MLDVDRVRSWTSAARWPRVALDIRGIVSIDCGLDIYRIGGRTRFVNLCGTSG